MNKKKKNGKTNGARKITRKSVSAPEAKSTGSSARRESASSQSAAKSGTSKPIWKRRPVLIATFAVIIVALIVSRILLFHGASKDNNVSTAPAVVPSSSAGKLEIRDVTVTDITDRNMTIRWKTNVPSTSELTAYDLNGTNSVGSWPDTALVTEHKVTLEKLASSTAYSVKIKSKDAAGNESLFESNGPYQTRPPILALNIAVGQPSPDFSLKAVTGENINLADYKDKKLMLVFWLMSCTACRDELPYLRDFWDRSQHDDLVLLAINIGENENLIKNYVIGQKLMFPVLLDQDTAVSKKYSIVHYPTIILLAPDKTVKKIREEPFKNAGEIEDFVRSVN